MACDGKIPCQIKLFIDSKVDTEIRFTVQPLSGNVFLLDGIANEFSSSKQKKRYFAYEILNKKNTTIVV